MALLYVDRTRYQTGLAECMMARFLGHHYLNSGIVLKGNSIPLTTGTSVHSPLEDICLYCKARREEDPELPTATLLKELEDLWIVRNAIVEAITDYTIAVDQTGLKGLTENPQDVNDIVTEQCSLVGGLVWVWVRKCLPWVLDNYEILAVEQEFELILSCSCGIGEGGTAQDHEARFCNGVCLMTRPDLILRHRDSGILVYVEFKTGADVMNYNYSMQYEDNVQFALGAAATERYFGEPVTELYVHALHKGKRDREYDADTREYSGPKRQNSPFCYVFYKEAKPPMIPEDVRPTYYTKDPLTGSKWGATENRGYRKMPLWEIKWQDKEDDVPYYEHYALNKLDDADLDQFIKFIGPIPNPKFLVDRLMIEMVAEEQRWAERIAYLDDVLDSVGGDVTHTDYQLALSEVIPRSWKCYNYGGWCEFQIICFQKEGWDDPLGLKNKLSQPRYERREPNHPIELQSEAFKRIHGNRTDQQAAE